MPISNTYLDQIDWDQLTNDPFVASWNRAKKKQSQRQMTHEDRTETNRRVRDAMKTMQESIVPQSPAELAAMFALGPVGGKAFKGAMLASGALASDDAEAGVFGHISPRLFSKFQIDAPKSLGSAYGRGLYFAEDDRVLDSYAELLKRLYPDQKLYKYRTEIPDEQISKMLALHRPMSEQPGLVRQLADELSTKKQKHTSASSLFNRIRRSRDFENKLLEYGIPGIRHVDNRSVRYAPGSENLVVFDPELTSILDIIDY